MTKKSSQPYSHIHLQKSHRIHKSIRQGLQMLRCLMKEKCQNSWASYHDSTGTWTWRRYLPYAVKNDDLGLAKYIPLLEWDALGTINSLADPASLSSVWHERLYHDTGSVDEWLKAPTNSSRRPYISAHIVFLLDCSQFAFSPVFCSSGQRLSSSIVNLKLYANESTDSMPRFVACLTTRVCSSG